MSKLMNIILHYVAVFSVISQTSHLTSIDTREGEEGRERGEGEGGEGEGRRGGEGEGRGRGMEQTQIGLWDNNK